jgi:hypothetical protein
MLTSWLLPIDFIFKITIFVLLVIKLSELFTKYALPTLKQNLNQEKQQRIELIEKDKMLSTNQQSLELQIAQQKKVLVTLDTKAKQWYEFMQQKQELAINTAQNNLHKITIKRKRQNAEYLRMNLAATSIPLAIQKARAELTDYYDKKGSSLLKEIVIDLNKRKQNG